MTGEAAEPSEPVAKYQAREEVHDLGEAACFTWGGALEGMRLTLPIVPTVCCFAGAIGAAAAEKGLSLFEATLMTAVVYVGVSQFVAIEQWTDVFTASTVIVLVASVAVINLRLVLLSAALRPWIGHLGAAAVYPTVMMISEPNWLIGMRYKAEGGRDAAVVFGSGLLLWVICVSMTVVGHVSGTLVADPKRYGLDLVTVLMFALMCVNFWKGHADTLAWCVAGASAVVVWWLIPGYWFVLVGAVAGATTAAFAPSISE